jgi:hypothetical protein
VTVGGVLVGGTVTRVDVLASVLADKGSRQCTGAQLVLLFLCWSVVF